MTKIIDSYYSYFTFLFYIAFTVENNSLLVEMTPVAGSSSTVDDRVVVLELTGTFELPLLYLVLVLLYSSPNSLVYRNKFKSGPDLSLILPTHPCVVLVSIISGRCCVLPVFDSC